MKEVVQGQLGKIIGYEVKIEDGKLKIAAVVDLMASVDEAVAAIPGDSAIEALIAQLVKSALMAI
jgi:hypothetical protein